MKVGVARAVMTLAVSCLGGFRRQWALAMQMEFEAARKDGKPLSFAFGCLAAALRELPTHEEGRFSIVSHVLAFVFIIPTAALLVSSLGADFPYSYLSQFRENGLPLTTGGQTPLLSDANRSAVPPLAALVIVIAASHLRVAWLVLERDWSGVAAVGTQIAAATVTLIIFTVIAFSYCAPALTQAAVLALELGSIAALARWHARPFGNSSETSHLTTLGP